MHASPAFDVATPEEFTSAVFHDHLGEARVAAAAAKVLAAVKLVRMRVATSAPCARRPQLLIGQAVVRRLFQENDVTLRWSSRSAARTSEPSAPFVEFHPYSVVVLYGEVLAHLVEGRQALPACLQTTGTGHPVALATDRGQAVNGLWKKEVEVGLLV